MSASAGDLKRNWSFSLFFVSMMLFCCVVSTALVSVDLCVDQPMAVRLAVYQTIIIAATILGVGTGISATLIALFVPEKDPSKQPR